MPIDPNAGAAVLQSFMHSQGATLNYLLFPEDLPGGLNNAKEFLQAPPWRWHLRR